MLSEFAVLFVLFHLLCRFPSTGCLEVQGLSYVLLSGNFLKLTFPYNLFDVVLCFVFVTRLIVNYGVLLLQALLEYWPETFTSTSDDADQEMQRADSPGQGCLLPVSNVTPRIIPTDKYPYPSPANSQN